MPVNVNQPNRREEESVLDKIAKAINIATQIYGVKVSSDKLGLEEKAQKDAQAEITRKNTGHLNLTEYGAVSDNLEAGKPTDTGAAKGFLPNNEEVYLKPRPNKVMVNPFETALTPGQKAADTAFGKEYSDYVASGGYATAKKNIDLLVAAREKLLAKDNGLSGPGKGLLDKVGLLPYLAKDSAAVKDDIESAVQANMKLILGSQFTEREGKNILQRAFNPALSPEANVKKLDAIIAEAQEKAAALERSTQQFQSSGTLRNLKGDVNVSKGGKKEAPSHPPGTILRKGNKTYRVLPDGKNAEEI